MTTYIERVDRTDYLKLLRALHADPDPADVVNFTDELTALEKVQREIDEIADKFGVVSATDALYGNWNPAEHIPADPTAMYQSGWVCNSKRAEIKRAYENQLHKDYNALFTKGTRK